MVKNKTQRAAGQQAAHDIHFRDEYMDEMMSGVAQYEKKMERKKQKSLELTEEGINVGGNSSDDDIYTVERIVDKKRIDQKTHYLVKWEGYGSD